MGKIAAQARNSQVLGYDLAITMRERLTNSGIFFPEFAIGKVIVDGVFDLEKFEMPDGFSVVRPRLGPE